MTGLRDFPAILTAAHPLLIDWRWCGVCRWLTNRWGFCLRRRSRIARTPFQSRGIGLDLPNVDAIESGYQFHQLRDCFSLHFKLLAKLLDLDFKLFCAHRNSSIGPFSLA